MENCLDSTGNTPDRKEDMGMESVWACLEKGGTVLTVNRRLARHLMDDFDRLQLEQGRSAWPTPDIVSLSGWLERCWDSLVGLPDLPAE
ncbi:MAG: hypothetical protein H7833_19805 [Magnetococcus sp. DMHC-1]